jgi:5'-3' exonuclease
LVRQKFGVAVLSIETDCISHRADVIINDIDKQTGMISFFNLQELMNEWDLHELQLIDFGILVENQEQKLHNSNLNLAKLSCHKN